VWAYREMAARESEPSGSQQAERAGPPGAVAAFAADTTIRSVTDPAGTIERWSEYDRGGHFPAMEGPADDIRATFRSQR